MLTKYGQLLVLIGQLNIHIQKPNALNYKGNAFFLRQRKEVVFYLCLFVCLSVCLSARLLKMLWTEFDEIFRGSGVAQRTVLDLGGNPDHDSGTRILKGLFTVVIPIDSQE